MIGFFGAGYEGFIVLGSLVVGYWVDRTKRYYRATVGCLILTVLWLICLSLDGLALNAYVILGTFMLLGLSVGPLEPCLADLSVEIVYPIDDNAVLSTLQVRALLARQPGPLAFLPGMGSEAATTPFLNAQVLGNIFAAASVPAFRMCRNRHANSYTSSLYFLVVSPAPSRSPPPPPGAVEGRET